MRPPASPCISNLRQSSLIVARPLPAPDAHFCSPRDAPFHSQLKSYVAAPATIAGMRCEMACAATHMSWGGRFPPASCALAVTGDGGALAAIGSSSGALTATGSSSGALAATGRASSSGSGGVRPEGTGVVATLMVILTNRQLPSRLRRRPRPCPCHNVSSEWHYFD